MASSCHTIQPNHATQTIHQAVWFDTETDPKEINHETIGHVLREGQAVYRRRLRDDTWSDPEWYPFTKIEQFWDWVEAHTRPKTTLYLFCHNTSFDLPVVDAFRQLPERGWIITRLCIEAPPTIIHARKLGRRLVLLDTLNWWRVPLKKLGKEVGLPKLDMPPPDAPPDDWAAYCKRDVEIIMEAVIRWTQTLKAGDLGGFAPTLASQAMRTWRHRYMKVPVIVHQDPRADAISRACYHGGRVEANRIGHYFDRVYLLDVNSMYPYVMQKHYYPHSLHFCTTVTNVAELRRYLKRYAVCARVNITVESPAVPCLRDKKLIYPIGTFDADLTTPELDYVLDYGTINKVYSFAAYRKADLFSSLVSDLYARRLDAASAGRTVEAYIYKILLNSLYGKFGQRGIVWTEVDQTPDLSVAVWDEVDVETGAVEHWRQLAGVIQVQETEAESRDSMPAIAAHVTANARMHLWALHRQAGRQNVYYSDTDSLLVNQEGYDNLRGCLDPVNLGSLKLEGTYDDFEIHGPKDYRFGEKVRIKGVSAKASYLGNGRYVMEHWAGLKSLVRGASMDLPQTRSVLKVLTRRYDKGLVAPDGKVYPFRLEEGGAS